MTVGWEYSSIHHTFGSWWNGFKYSLTKWATSRFEHDFSIKQKDSSILLQGLYIQFQNYQFERHFDLLFGFSVCM